MSLSCKKPGQKNTDTYSMVIDLWITVLTKYMYRLTKGDVGELSKLMKMFHMFIGILI